MKVFIKLAERSAAVTQGWLQQSQGMVSGCASEQGRYRVVGPHVLPEGHCNQGNLLMFLKGNLLMCLGSMSLVTQMYMEWGNTCAE